MRPGKEGPSLGRLLRLRGLGAYGLGAFFFFWGGGGVRILRLRDVRVFRRSVV